MFEIKYFSKSIDLPASDIRELYESVDHSTIFQDIPLFSFFENTFHHKPFVVCCYDDKTLCSAMFGVLIEDTNTLHIENGPLIKPDYPDDIVTDLMLNMIDQVYPESKIKFRWLMDFPFNESTFRKYGYIKEQRFNIIQTIDLEDVCMKKYSLSKRRQVTLSKRNGLIIEVANTIEDVQHFSTMLNNRYQEKLKRNGPPLNFIDMFFTILQRTNKGVLLIAKVNEKIVGGILCLISEGKILHEWYIVGLDAEYEQQKIYPSVSLTHAALEYAKENKLEKFDFMGAGKKGIPYGVRDFKLRFGGELIDVCNMIKN